MGVKQFMKKLERFLLPYGPVVKLLKTATALANPQPETMISAHRNWLEAVDKALTTWPVTKDNDFVIRNAQTGQVCIWLSHVPGLDDGVCVLTHYYEDELLYTERYFIDVVLEADGRGSTQVHWVRTEV